MNPHGNVLGFAALAQTVHKARVRRGNRRAAHPQLNHRRRHQTRRQRRDINLSPAKGRTLEIALQTRHGNGQRGVRLPLNIALDLPLRLRVGVVLLVKPQLLARVLENLANLDVPPAELLEHIKLCVDIPNQDHKRGIHALAHIAAFNLIVPVARHIEPAVENRLAYQPLRVALGLRRDGLTALHNLADILRALRKIPALGVAADLERRLQIFVVLNRNAVGGLVRQHDQNGVLAARLEQIEVVLVAVVLRIRRDEPERHRRAVGLRAVDLVHFPRELKILHAVTELARRVDFVKNNLRDFIRNHRAVYRRGADFSPDILLLVREEGIRPRAAFGNIILPQQTVERILHRAPQRDFVGVNAVAHQNRDGVGRRAHIVHVPHQIQKLQNFRVKGDKPPVAGFRRVRAARDHSADRAVKALVDGVKEALKRHQRGFVFILNRARGVLKRREHGALALGEILPCR